MRWSRYAPVFLEPVVNKEMLCKPLTELSKEEREQWEFKTTCPIKAAPSSVTSSVFSDPLIRSEKAPSFLLHQLEKKELEQLILLPLRSLSVTAIKCRA